MTWILALTSTLTPGIMTMLSITLIRPVSKPPASTGGELASTKGNSGRLASALMQKLDPLAGAGSVTAGHVPSPGPLKPGALASGKTQPARQDATVQADGMAASASSTGLPAAHPQPGPNATPALAASGQATVERAPVKSMMGAEASKLAARLAKVTGEAGIQLSTGRVPVGARGSLAPPAQPGYATKAGLRPSGAASSRDLHR